MNNGKHEQGTNCTKMGADSSAENTPICERISALASKRVQIKKLCYIIMLNSP